MGALKRGMGPTQAQTQQSKPFLEVLFWIWVCVLVMWPPTGILALVPWHCHFQSTWPLSWVASTCCLQISWAAVPHSWHLQLPSVFHCSFTLTRSCDAFSAPPLGNLNLLSWSWAVSKSWGEVYTQWLLHCIVPHGQCQGLLPAQAIIGPLWTMAYSSLWVLGSLTKENTTFSTLGILSS